MVFIEFFYQGRRIGLNLIIGFLDVTDLEILVVLVTRLLRRDLDRLVEEIEPVEP
jgi:hypothetical protein